MYKIAVLPGDGIGQEVIPEALKILQVGARGSGVGFEFEQGLVGGAAIDEAGDPLPDATFRLCEASRAILFGAVGGPQWDDVPHERRPDPRPLPLPKQLYL